MGKGAERAKLLKAAREQGWAVDETSRRHVKLVAPEGQPYFIPRTPSDHRGHKNNVALLRKGGLKI